MALVSTVVAALWAMLPAYVPNNAAVVAGGGRPIDGGQTWGGKRLLGDGKTWRGTIAGTVAGATVAGLLNVVRDPLSQAAGISLPAFSVGVALALAFGAMAGDIVASFVKRRSGRRRGDPVPLVDQLDFAIFAIAFAYVVDAAWVVSVFFTPLTGLLAVLVATPLLHVLTNGIAYVLGLKAEPW